MTAHPTWFVGNREPPIEDTIRDAVGNPIDLTGKTFHFMAREVGSATLLVDQPVSNTLDATGEVVYEWSAADAATGALSKPRQLLVWWRDMGGPQDVNEAMIVVADHASLEAYVELEVFKASASLSGKASKDEEIKLALLSASRGLEAAYNRGQPFGQGPAGEVRYFSSDDRRLIRIDPATEITELAFDYYGLDEYSTVLSGSDYRLQPIDADTREEPWTEVYLLASGSSWPYWGAPTRAGGIRVTGTFGWPVIPPGVKSATMIVAGRLLERTTSAPFGIIAFGQDQAAVRAGEIALDPEVRFAMKPAARPRRLVI